MTVMSCAVTPRSRAQCVPRSPREGIRLARNSSEGRSDGIASAVLTALHESAVGTHFPACEYIDACYLGYGDRRRGRGHAVVLHVVECVAQLRTPIGNLDPELRPAVGINQADAAAVRSDKLVCHRQAEARAALARGALECLEQMGARFFRDPRT